MVSPTNLAAPPAPAAMPPLAGQLSGTGTATGGAAPAVSAPRGSTPFRLRFWQVAVAALSALLALVLVVAVDARRSQLDRVEEAAELVVATQDLRGALGRADAASVNAFLAGGVDQPDQRQRYSQALDEAASALQRAGVVARSDQAAAAVAELQQFMPRYSGLIETARANNRQQLPLGAAYLRRGSDLLRSDVAPQLDALSGAGEQSLRDIDEDVTAGLGLVPLTMIAVLLVALLVAQRWLAGRTRRRLNPGLVAATMVMVVGSIWLGGRFGDSGGFAADGLTDGYDQLAALSALRTDAYDHQANATFALVDRGAREQFNARASSGAGRVDARLAALPQEFGPSMSALSPPQDVSRGWAAYLEASNAATAADLAGQSDAARSAITASVNDDGTVAGRFETFDRAVLQRLDLADQGLDRGLRNARGALAGGELVSVLLALFVAGGAAWGLQRRLSEYR